MLECCRARGIVLRDPEEIVTGLHDISLYPTGRRAASGGEGGYIGSGGGR